MIESAEMSLYKATEERHRRLARSSRRWARFCQVYGLLSYAAGAYFLIAGAWRAGEAILQNTMGWATGLLWMGLSLLWFLYTAPRMMKSYRLQRDAADEWEKSADLYASLALTLEEREQGESPWPS